MKNVFAFIVVLGFCFNASATGAEGVGGGGGVACVTESAVSLSLLDFYEAEKLYGFKPDLPPLNISLSEKPVQLISLKDHPFLKEIRSRLLEALKDDHNPKRVHQTVVNEMLLPAELFEVVITPDMNLPFETQDLGRLMVQIPNHCTLLQLATQEVRKVAFDFSQGMVSIRISQSALSMGAVDISGLLLHEFLHYWFSIEKHTLSLRQTTMYLAAPKEFRRRNRHLMPGVILKREAADPKSFH